MKTASWVITDENGNAICEVFCAQIVARVNPKYKVVPILEYLQNFNRKLKIV